MLRTPFMTNWSPLKQIIVFLLLILSGVIIFSALAMLIISLHSGVSIAEVDSLLDPYHPNMNISYLKLFQIFSHFGMFLIPTLIMAFYSDTSVRNYLFFKNKLNPLYLVLGGVFILAVSPLLNIVIEWNANLQLPEEWAIVQWMKNQEENAAQLTVLLLNDTSLWGLSVNIFMIAIVPAFSEEFVFRGFLFRFFSKFIKNNHLIVIITSLLFSAMHMQFYGFFPRFILGIVLGYLLIYSGNMLVPMFAHFVNNATAVIVAYFAAKEGTIHSMENLEIGGNSILYVVLSILICLPIAVYMLKSEAKLKL